VVIKQQNLFLPVMLKWTKNRLVHSLLLIGSLTWKAEQCNIMVVHSFHDGVIQV
jgi:hypothetical protein